MTASGRCCGKTAQGEFLCECNLPDCTATITMLLDHYESLGEDRTALVAHGVSSADWRSIAEQPNRYLLVPEHLLSEGEEVVDYLGEYEVVEKPA